ncbi:MAG: polyphenol oxidase family protein [Nocardioides sp.]
MTFLFRDTVSTSVGTVSVGFTERRLDVGDHAEPEVRAAALAELAEATGARPALMRQVHGAEVAVIEGPSAGEDRPRADALVTDRAGLALLARAADCVPVLLVGDHGLIGAVHCGRPGLAAGVVPAAVARMRHLGSRELVAVIGPHVCGACYEVPEEMRDDIAALVPAARSTTSWGTPALDLGAGVGAQLEAAGVTDVGSLDRCTREDEAWPSYRRDGAAATRFAGVVWRQP